MNVKKGYGCPYCGQVIITSVKADSTVGFRLRCINPSCRRHYSLHVKAGKDGKVSVVQKYDRDVRDNAAMDADKLIFHKAAVKDWDNEKLTRWLDLIEGEELARASEAKSFLAQARAFVERIFDERRKQQVAAETLAKRVETKPTKNFSDAKIRLICSNINDLDNVDPATKLRWVLAVTRGDFDSIKAEYEAAFEEAS
jgi:hypothetical protein